MFDFHLNGRLYQPHGSFLKKLRVAGCVLVLIALLAGCEGGSSNSNEYVYVAVPEAALRDRVAAVYNKTGTVHNGDKLAVLERMQNRRFVRVRGPHGEEGWLQERYLADQATFNQSQHLAQEFKTTPAQGTATVQQQVRVHVAPGLKAGSLYMLDEKQKVSLLERRPVDRNAPVTATASRDDKSKEPDDSPDDEAPSGNQAAAIWNDWWLVRDAQNRIGWVLGRALFLEVPDEVAQYAEGQRIVAAFPLDEVQDEDKKVAEYLVLFTEPKDGMPYDFNQIRVFTWNTRKHRYETAYRERNLAGNLPVTLGSQDFEKEGILRTFTVHLKTVDGSPREQTYKFRSPMVRKIYAAGQEPAPKNRAKARSRSTT